ncbi:MAG TPA: RND transporter, partial [Verrucomicrobiae bacterium]|nr:RND transporter [Verrucomicrobiae bacterium]
MRTASLISILALVAGLAGCSVGPNYHRPAALPGQTSPEKFSGETPSGTNQVVWKIAEPSSHLARSEWWAGFNDPELNRLETLA